MKINKRLSGETAKMYALRVISENIINVQLIPGSLVSENELANALGISRTPVREALQELQKSQLIEVIPQRGSFIAKVSFDIIEETVFLRRVLESAIVEELCDQITEQQILILEENIQLQEYYLSKGMLEKIFELDNKLHFELFCMCHKERIYQLMASMMGHFDRIRTLSLYSIKEIRIVEDHKAIVHAIKAHDKQLAKDLIVTHLLRYKVDKEEVMKKYPEYF